MNTPRLIIIAAVSDNGVIGSDNSLPWYLPEDLKRFKRLTEGKTVLMGKKTFDSIMARLGKPLPNRVNVVLSRQEDPSLPEGVIQLKDIDEISSLEAEEVMVIGGGQIYDQLIDHCERMYITHVHQTIDGDVRFPDVDWSQWQNVFEEKHEGYTFVDYERNS